MDLATKDDLHKMKEELISELRTLLKEEKPGQKQFLKSREVMEMLGCSESKLSSLRASGKLPCRKIQGTYYYKQVDISALLM